MRRRRPKTLYHRARPSSSHVRGHQVAHHSSRETPETARPPQCRRHSTVSHVSTRPSPPPDHRRSSDREYQRLFRTFRSSVASPCRREGFSSAGTFSFVFVFFVLFCFVKISFGPIPNVTRLPYVLVNRGDINRDVLYQCFNIP